MTTTGSGSQELASFSYEYDSGDMPSAQEQYIVGNPANGRYEYTYDNAKRLTLSASPVENISYTYDDRGNRTSKNIAGTTTNYSYNAANQLTGDSNGNTYEYDVCGNMIEKGTTTYTYDELGRMTEANAGGSAITYNYDALSRMVKRDAGSSSEYLMLYGTADQPLTINNQDSSTSYLWTPDGTRLLGAVNYSGTEPVVHSVVTNGHSDLSLTIGQDQSVTSSNIYRPYGEVQAHAGTLNLPLGYQPDYTDSATGLVDMGKRNYDPSLGTFTTPDPKAPEVTDSYSYNTYLYTNDAPLGRIDPTGENWLGDLWNSAKNLLRSTWHGVTDFISDCYHAVSGVLHGKSIKDIRQEREERERQREIRRQKAAEERKRKQEAKKRRKEENKKRFKESTKGQAKKKSLWDKAWDKVVEAKDALVSTTKRIVHEVKKGIDKLRKKAEKAIAAIGGAVTKAVKKVAGAVVRTAKAVRRAVQAGARAVGRGIAAGARAVGRGLKTAWDKAGEIAGEAWADVKKGAGDIWKEICEHKEGIKTALKWGAIILGTAALIVGTAGVGGFLAGTLGISMETLGGISSCKSHELTGQCHPSLR